MLGDFFGEKKKKRTLGIRNKQLLWERAKKQCELCNKKLELHQVEVGHKRAYSKGGSTSFRNLVCLCHDCNKKQGTDDWKTIHKKLGKELPKSNRKTVKKPKKKKKKKKKDDSIFGLFD